MLSSNDLDQYAMRSLTIFAPSPLLSLPVLPSDPWSELNRFDNIDNIGTGASFRETGGWSVWAVTQKIFQL